MALFCKRRRRRELNALITNQKLQGLYISLSGYLNSASDCKNLIDLSCWGGSSLLVFENIVIELVIHVEGIICYRMYQRTDLKIKMTKDYSPNDLRTDFNNTKYFWDVSNFQISHEFLNHILKFVWVIGTDTWGFSVNGFDEAVAEKAAKNGDLPTEIDLILDNGVQIKFIGDFIEDYYIKFQFIRKILKKEEQIELNRELCKAVSESATIDVERVQYLLDSGADPIGMYDPDDNMTTALDELFIDVQSYDGNIPEKAKQLPEVVKMFLDYGMDCDSTNIDVLHSLTWLRYEYGVQTLALLLENGLSAGYSSGFVYSLIGDIMQFEKVWGDDKSWQESVVYALKMTMLVAAFQINHLNKPDCKEIKHLIEPEKNKPDILPEFKNWNAFEYEVDFRNGDSLDGRMVKIYRKDTHEMIWKFTIKSQFF